MRMAKVAVGCDHGGFPLKDAVVATLESLGAEVVDFGCDSTESVDYPKYGYKVAKAVASGECDLGVIMCGTGIGISIAANKVKGACRQRFYGGDDQTSQRRQRLGTRRTRGYARRGKRHRCGVVQRLVRGRKASKTP